jgi:hypothetical protein
MAKRLQVILQDQEYRDIRRIARMRGMSIAEWARQAIEAARRSESPVAADKKLAVIRSAARHQGPSCDVEQMLAEIEGGYLQ